jgi:hypothetical protein
VKKNDYKELSKQMSEYLRNLPYREYLDKILNWINQK